MSTAGNATRSTVDPASQHSTNIGNFPAYANSVFCHTPIPYSQTTHTVILSFCHTYFIYIIKFNNLKLSRSLYKIHFIPLNVTEENFKKEIWLNIVLTVRHLEVNPGLALLPEPLWSPGFLSLDFHSQIKELIFIFYLFIKILEVSPKCWESKMKLFPSKTNCYCRLLNNRHQVQACVPLLNSCHQNMDGVMMLLGLCHQQQLNTWKEEKFCLLEGVGSILV